MDEATHLEKLQSELANLRQQLTNLPPKQADVDEDYDDLVVKLQENLTRIDSEIQTLQREPEKPETSVIDPPISPALNSASNLRIVLDSSLISARKQPQFQSVDPGFVVVVNHAIGQYDQDGQEEYYWSGDTIIRNKLQSGSQYRITKLAEFPGEITFTATAYLPGISQTESDLASMYLKLRPRVVEPGRTLRYSGGQYMLEKERAQFDKKVNDAVNEWLSQKLAGRAQLWSDLPHEVYDSIISALNGELKAVGLQIDPTPTAITGTSLTASAPRRFPPALYEIVFQFAKAERILLEAMTAQDKLLLDQTGLAEKDLLAIKAVAEQKVNGPGAGVFIVVKNGSPALREKFSGWLIGQAAATASKFLRDVYADATHEAGAKLSEQVLLGAFRNPVLAVGEWYDPARTDPEIQSGSTAVN
jgi:hypothetical protein